MRQAKFLIFLLIATLFSLAIPPLVLAETTELTTVADAFVNDGYIGQNQGSAQSIVTSRDSVYRWGLISFDLSSISTGAIIDSAALKLYQYDSGGDESAPLKVYRITGAWAETEVTWNSQPDFDSGSSVTANLDKTVGWKTWDITEIVRGWKNGDYSNYGLAQSHNEGNFSRTFRSREYNENRPTLAITYHLPASTPTPTPTLSPTLTPTPTSTPKLTATPTQSQLNPTPTEEVSPTPEESLIASEASEEQKGKVLQLTSGQLLIGATIILALIAAAAAFIAYSRRQPDKETKEEPEENEKDSDTKVGENE